MLLGTAFVAVRPSTTGFASEANRQVKSGFAGIPAIAAKAAKLSGVAMVVGLAASVKSFAGFQTDLNEVFTLLPGISGDAMSQMQDQVFDLANDFGVLPNEIIPGLYDSLSAGVSQDNVFTFLEASTKFAKAGATDVSTAVDLLTTATNAFGLEASAAGLTSDVLFAGVKLGKTTVAELSASLFQVAPNASAAGVSLEATTAALATLTAQGVPTSAAAVQMKGAFGELTKAGSKADKAFRDVAGQGFKAFIAGGGSVDQAFNLMYESAQDAGVGVGDYFGSVEAGNAVMSLTGDKAGLFADALDGVAGAAGGVEGAFAVMDKGILPAFNRIKARFVTGGLRVGNAIAPFVESALNKVLEFGPLVADTGTEIIESLSSIASKAEEYLGPVVDTVIDVFRGISTEVSPVFANIVSEFGSMWGELTTILGPPLAAISGAVSDLGAVFGEVLGPVGDGASALLDDFGPAVEDAFDWVVKLTEEALVPLMDWIASDFLPGVGEIVTSLGDAAEAVGNWATENDLLIPSLFAIGAGIATWKLSSAISSMRILTTSVGLNVGALAAQSSAFIVANGPILLLAAGVALAAGALVWAWRNVDWFRESIEKVLSWVGDAASAVAGWVTENDLLIPALAGLATVIGVVLLNELFLLFPAMVTAVVSFGAAALSAASYAASVFVAAAATALAAAPVILLIAGIALLAAGLVWAWRNVDWFRDAVKGAFGWIADRASPIIDGFRSAISKIGEVVGTVASAIGGAFTASLNAVVGFFGDAYDAATNVADVIGGALAKAWDGAGTAIGAIVDAGGTVVGFFTDLYDAATDVAGVVGGALMTAWEAVSGVFDTVAGAVGSVKDAFSSAAGVVSGVFSSAAKDLEPVIAPWKSLFQRVKGDLEPLSPVFDAVGSAIGVFVGGAKGVASAIAGFVGGIAGVPAKIGAGLSAAIGAVTDFVASPFEAAKDLVGGIIDKISDVVGIKLNAVTAAIAVALAPVGLIFGGIFGVAKVVLGFLSRTVGTVFGFIGQTISAVMGAVGDVFSAVFGAIYEVASPVIGWLVEQLGETFSVLLANAGIALDIFGAVFGVVFDVIGFVVGVALDMIGIAWDLFIGVLTIGSQVLAGTLGLIWSVMFGAVSLIVTGGIAIISGLWDGLSLAVTTVFGLISSTITGAWETVTGVVSPIVESLTTGAQTAFATAKTKISTAVTGTKDAIVTAFGLVTAPFDTMLGLVDRLISKFGVLKDVAGFIGGLAGIGGGGEIAENFRGGLITKPILSTLGEGFRPELVLPLTDPTRSIELLRHHAPNIVARAVSAPSLEAYSDPSTAAAAAPPARQLVGASATTGGDTHWHIHGTDTETLLEIAERRERRNRRP